MKHYLLLHYGIEKPTPEIMAWVAWFASIADRLVDGGRLPGGSRSP